MKGKRCDVCKGEGWVAEGLGEAGVMRCEPCEGDGVVSGHADEDDDGPTVVRRNLRLVDAPVLRVVWHKEAGGDKR